MIQLNPDCLIFQTADGENIPCSAELVTIELIGDTAPLLDPELVQNASAAVLHYFKVELAKTFVTVAEFSEALEKVLRGFGLLVTQAKDTSTGFHPEEADLRQLAVDAGGELFFFLGLRAEMRRKLEQSPYGLRFCGLRDCVKQITGAQRWNRRCEALSDQIVEYIRHCVSLENRAESCALVVL